MTIRTKRNDVTAIKREFRRRYRLMENQVIRASVPDYRKRAIELGKLIEWGLLNGLGTKTMNRLLPEYARYTTVLTEKGRREYY